MRKINIINEDWKFYKEGFSINHRSLAKGEDIKLPHTWNANDGQDGGNDYYRGQCWYTKELGNFEIIPGQRLFLEFRGINSSATVYLNQEKLAYHDGGYSTFRVDITDGVQSGSNLLAISVDNSKNETVYPQRADFTFYGGIYRDVYLISVCENHFSLDYFGSPGIKVTPSLAVGTAEILCEAFITGDAQTVNFEISGIKQEASVNNGYASAVIILDDPRLWNGRKDPYLYCLRAELINDSQVVDEASLKFGCRNFEFDSENGFFLNGESYPLRGVSRHQDRKGVGNAITEEMQKEDMEIIAEMGANTIRLAHYQHDQFFYELCDENGMIVWAEIPYITEHMNSGQENTLLQMRELVVQNHHHPSIVCWGLSNEVTVAGITDELIENNKLLNDLVHKMDSTRPTVLANVFILESDSELLEIPDILSYNLYYGWYVGEVEDNAEWFDKFHEKYPNRIIGLSEYGADASVRFQTASPEKGDYTEQYQAVYHEYMMKMLSERPYIWASHVWNMFDFGADGRNEGGENGVNQKGLVTFDRKIKKDAFYLYKAYLSNEPFVHICDRRYIERTDKQVKIKVYSNQRNVSLYMDGEKIADKSGDRIFNFTIPLSTEHVIEARSNDLSDQIRIRKVVEQNPKYSMNNRNVMNWFDMDEAKEGYLSIKDSIEEIIQDPNGKRIVEEFNVFAIQKFGDVAKNVKISPELQTQMNKASFESQVKQLGNSVPYEMIQSMNYRLNQIKKA